MKIFPTEFDGKATRRVYGEATETWWFSVVDVLQLLTLQHGRSDTWIQQRMTRQETRNKLTDYWREHDMKALQASTLR